VLMPAFKAAGARLKTVASRAGVSGLHAGKKFDFEETTTDVASILEDEAIVAVSITTRHDSHAQFVIQALDAGKHVFVEKPLCLTLNELDAIAAAHERTGARSRPTLLMVGFNRRFAPHSQTARRLLAGNQGPKAIVMTVNAGSIPADHWTQDSTVGGGRIVGEACHFIDLARYLIGSPIISHSRADMESATNDTVTLNLHFADGSIATIHYLANGSKAFPKERVEVFAGGKILQLDNFRTLRGFGWPGFHNDRLWRQDKGQKACAAAFVGAIRDGGAPPIPFDEIAEVSRVSIELAAQG